MNPQQQEINRLLAGQKKLIAEQCKLAAQNRIIAHDNLLRVQANSKEMQAILASLRPVKPSTVDTSWIDGLIESL